MTLSPSQNEYPLPKNSYAAFDAISLRNLIIQRLNEEGIFTDQNYIGSNLAAIIDIVSYTFNSLMFYLHKTSNEATFTEAQLYENISRIVKLLDYKPIGYQTSTLSFEVSAQNLPIGLYTIPRYSYLQVGGVPFSFAEDISFNIAENSIITPLIDISNKKLLYQGIYRENPVYTAAGDPNEVVTTNIANAFVDHFNMDVYVYEQQQEKWIQYLNVPTLYTEQSFARIFEKRLNPDKNYEIVFGDGINGRQLQTGDRVLIYFLQSNGDQGVIGPDTLKEASKNLFSTTNFPTVLADLNNEQFVYINRNDFNNLYFSNTVGSTVPKEVEDADSIKKNAPSNFKSQYRLVTKEDFESFIKINFANFISDVKIFDNWQYTKDYLGYFKDIQVKTTEFRQILLNQILYADSCNFNNIYICGLPKTSLQSSLKYLLPAQKEIILSNIQSLKTLTTEVVFLDPIYQAVAIGIGNDESFVVTDRQFCKLQFVKSTNSRRSNSSILQDAENVFKAFFNPINLKLGGSFSYSNLVSELLNIDGVSDMNTTRVDTNETVKGLSLYMWNPSFEDLDKKIVRANVELNNFQLAYFDDLPNLISRLEVTENRNYIT
jgi:hypothetical protein